MRIKSVLSGLVLVLSATPLHAQTWVDVSPLEGRRTSDLLFDSADPAQTLVATDVGVFSRDRPDRRWELLSELARIADLEAHPTRSEVLLAGTEFEIFRSTDRGASWRNVSDLGLGGGDLVRIAPSDPEVVYSVRSLTGWLLRSDDGGETWQLPGTIYEDLGQAVGLVVDPDDSRSLLIAGRGPGLPHFGVIYQSTDGGATWQRTADDLLATAPASFLGAGIAPGELYLGAGAGELYRSRAPQGVDWTPIGAGLPLERYVHVQDVAVDARRPDRLLVVVDQAESWPTGTEVGNPPTVWRSDDDGATWEASATGLPREHRIARLLVSPHDPDEIYAPGSRGLYRSTDGGATWSVVEPDLPSAGTEIVVLPDRPDSLLLLGGFPRLARTDDGGASWQTLFGPGSGLPVELTDIEDVALAPGPSPAVYALARDFPDLRFLRSDDRGQVWEELGEGLEDRRLDELALLPAAPQVLLAAGQSGAYRSADEGRTWSQTSIDTMVADLAPSPVDPSRVWASVQLRFEHQDTDPWGVWRSTDAGATWRLSRAGLPANPLPITALVAHPRQPATALAALRGFDDGGTLGLLYRTTDGGRTWSLWATVPAPLTSLRFDSTRPATLVAGSVEGTYRSLDGGRTWQPLGDDLPYDAVEDLALRPDGSVAYAATAAGVFRLALTDDGGGGPDVPPPPGPWLDSPSVAGFRLKVRIGGGATPVVDGAKELDCIPETVCISGALPGRSELFVRIVGPRPNGFLWPTLVRFTPSRVEVWIEQLATGEVRHYVLPAPGPDDDTLPGLQDRTGFEP